MLKIGSRQMSGEIWDEMTSSELVEVMISHQQDRIKSLQFTYRSNENVIHSQTHGVPDGSNFNMVVFDYPSEVLTSVSGGYKYGRLCSIEFGTNKRKYGPFGRTDRSDLSSTFTYEFEPRRFGGFYGSAYPTDGSVSDIGVYVKPYSCDRALAGSLRS